MLFELAEFQGIKGSENNELFVETVSNPEYSLALLHLYRVETKARATLVQPNAM